MEKKEASEQRTEQKMAYAPELLYEALVHSTDDFIYLNNRKTGEFQYSKEMVELFGLPGEVIKDPLDIWKKIVHPDDWNHFYQSNMRIGKEEDLHIAEFRAQTVDGEYIWMRCRGCLMRDEQGNPELFAGIMQRLGRQNKIDPLTQLLNYQEFLNSINGAVKAKSVENLGVIILNIDNFRLINEMYDRELGDKILLTLSRAVQWILPENAALYRLDNDQMGILIGNSSEKEIKLLYEKIQKTLFQIRDWKQYQFKVEISAGCAWYPYDGSLVNELFQYADYALQYAKEKGKNRIVFFNEEILLAKKHSLKLIRELREAISEDYRGFYLQYQPQMDRAGTQIKGVEALVRWRDADGNFVSPVEFLPILEEQGMIGSLGLWVARNAMRSAKKWLSYNRDFKVSINASALQIVEASFAEDMQKIAREEKFPCSNLIVELTESCAVKNINILMENFRKLREIGTDVAMDDFGTGYSSLQMLKDTPVNIVKIDKSFVKDILNSEFNLTFISFVVSICHMVGIKVCLEGVETAEEFKVLKDVPLDYIQGYYFGRPVNGEEITEKIKESL